MELSQKLKELRKKQGLTQLDLAEKLFVSRQAISGWEAGTSRPSTENLHSLSKLYNVPLEMLLDDAAAAESEPEKIPEEDRPEEEKCEPEQNKARKGRRYKSLAILIFLLLILIVVAILIHREADQERLEVLSFNEMESKTIDITEDTMEVPLVGFD